MNPYDRPSDPAKRHSAALTDGPDRAPARAMLKAIGFTDEDLARPIVGAATLGEEITAWLLLGGLLVIAGVALAQFGLRRSLPRAVPVRGR